VAAAGALASCSSDDEITSSVDGDIQTGKVITTAISNEGSSNKTRMGFQMAKEKTIANTLSYNDVVWAYSATANWFNKLKPTFDGGEEFVDTESKYVSDGTVKYNAKGEELLVIYTADRTTHKEAYEGSLNTWTLDRTNAHSHDLAYIHGPKDSIPYYDNNNAFAFRAAYGYVEAKEDRGNLYGLTTKTDDNGENVVNLNKLGNKVNLISYMPLLRFSLPCATGVLGDDEKETEVSKVLSQLDYKIIIDAVPSSAGTSVTSGFPQKVEFTKITKTKQQTNEDPARPRDYQRCFVPTSVTLGNSVKLYYKADAKVGSSEVANGKYEPSYWLWHTNANAHTKDNGMKEDLESNDYKDMWQGYVFIPIAPVKYSLVRIKVNVSYAGKDEKLDAALEDSGILGTYEYSKTDLDEMEITASTKSHVDAANTVYDLGSIWSRSSTITYAPAANSAPRLAPAKVTPGEGWKKVSDADFDF